jgi:phosphoenolpyruvate carboxylase
MSAASDNTDLRNDVRRLADLLGQTLARQEGEELLALVESVRLSVRQGQQDEILNKLNDSQTISLVRAFSTFFNLANVAEQVNRAKDIANSHTKGAATRDKTDMAGAIRTANPSGLRSANCFGTNSPMISEK